MVPVLLCILPFRLFYFQLGSDRECHFIGINGSSKAESTFSINLKGLVCIIRNG